MNFRGQLWPIPPHRCVHRQFGLMEAVRETAVGSRGGKHETITLQAETTTPRRRTLSASFLRERTPVGELPLAQRQRKKNEGKARERALCRLFPDKHCLYKEAERARKQDAALRAERGEIVRRPGKRCSDVWLARRLPMRLRLLRCHRLPGSSRRVSALRLTCRRWSSGKKSVRRVGSCRVSGAQLNV